MGWGSQCGAGLGLGVLLWGRGGGPAMGLRWDPAMGLWGPDVGQGWGWGSLYGAGLGSHFGVGIWLWG